MCVIDLDVIFRTPLRKRRLVERELRKCRSASARRILEGCLEKGIVRGDWRRVLVRKRIEKLAKKETKG